MLYISEILYSVETQCKNHQDMQINLQVLLSIGDATCAHITEIVSRPPHSLNMNKREIN
jgi:hypothetical protein